MAGSLLPPDDPRQLMPAHLGSERDTGRCPSAGHCAGSSVLGAVGEASALRECLESQIVVDSDGADSPGSAVVDIITACRAAHDRLRRTMETLTDGTTRRPSQLPGWTVGHVLTHIARNADSHIRMMEAALRGEAVEQYAGGYEERAADIEAGAARPAAVLRDDVRATARALEETWDSMTPRAWEGTGLAGGRPWPCKDLPFHRWREVEIHHVDLGMSYGYAEWPEDYVRLELPRALAALPDRLHDSSQRPFLAWLLGRAEQPDTLDIDGWQTCHDHYFRTGA